MLSDAMVAKKLKLPIVFLMMLTLKLIRLTLTEDDVIHGHVVF